MRVKNRAGAGIVTHGVLKRRTDHDLPT
jgi:hypothetical protein